MLVLAAEKPSSHASIHAVNDVDLIVRANLLSLSSWHVGPSFQNDTPSENRKCVPDEQCPEEKVERKHG